MSASSWPGLAIPKPEPRKRSKRRRQRTEAKVKTSVRQQCVDRDGYCAIDKRADAVTQLLMPCDGPSEWAHIGRHRRSVTRGMAPERRHTTAGSAMLCRRHHRAYDAHQFDIKPTTKAGMNGPFRIVRRAA